MRDSEGLERQYHIEIISKHIVEPRARNNYDQCWPEPR